jgi:hypothetical protein
MGEMAQHTYSGPPIPYANPSLMLAQPSADALHHGCTSGTDPAADTPRNAAVHTQTLTPTNCNLRNRSRV